MSQIVSQFVPKQNRAIMADIEAAILALGPDAQTASQLNNINGQAHRFVAAGSGQAITIADFARAKLSLDKAFVPNVGRVAIVDPVTEYHLATISNLVGLDANPQYEGIVNTGLSTCMRFIRNILGFDVYVSNYLKSGISETIDSVSVSSGVANLFFSAAPDVAPFVGNLRQPPKVDSEYNTDLQRDEYVTTCRYGFKLFRPENMVVVLTKSTI